MIRHRIAAIAATTVAVLGIVGIGIAYADSTVNVPNANGQLTGTVFVCVNTANEGQQYVELKHPAPGNCAAGYLQYQAQQPDVDTSGGTPAPNVNSESFGSLTAAGPDKFIVQIPPGSHIVGTVTAVDLDATLVKPDAVTVTSVDNVTGEVHVTYAAGTVGHTIQITYDYQL